MSSIVKSTMATVSGKVILITGGAGGIGFAMIKELLQNGSKGVAIVDASQTSGDRVLADLAPFGPNRAIFIKADVTKKEELERAFDTTVQTFKQLDIVINNAGIINEIEWELSVAVNFVAVVEGTYLAMQKYLPQYKSGAEGVIVNTASVLGMATMQLAPMYCATKHAVVGLGKTLGGDEFYKKYQVRVLTILPGVVRTYLIDPKNKDSKPLFEYIRDEEFKALNPIEQEPERVGKALIEVIQKGQTGSLWVIEDDEPLYEIVVPSYKTMKV